MKYNFDILKNFNFEFAPVGVKFTASKPDELPKCDKKLAMCEMFVEAMKSETGFYAEVDNHACGVGPYITGQVEGGPGMVSGQLGPNLGVYDDPRANRHIYFNMPKLQLGSCPYILFQKVENICFDPDLVIFVCKPSQAEILLRAKGYHNGEPWNAKGTPVAGCAYLYMYPYISGEVNMMVTGLHHGMKVRGLLPEGLIMLSVPFQVLPELMRNLEEMKWDLPQYKWGREYHMQHMKELGEQAAKLFEKK